MFTSNFLSTTKSTFNIAKVKHNPDASRLIDEGISQLEPFAQKICKKLRTLILSADPDIIEDWKWGPNYYLNGMVCGFWGFKKHTSLVFFQGSLLKDKKKVLLQNPGNVHNRHIKFTDVKQIDDELILEYLFEAIDNNKKGLKIIEAKDKTVDIPDDVKKQFKTAKVLAYFESLAYSHRKEYMMWITDAKKEETRLKRITQAIEKLLSKQMMHDKYKK
ncbi:MAG: YdeI/OmpD-associated family protein [Bacteroidetes bacterium]|nr:YdeI/OmpD-associated family protein [Bacteroidota bacterium]